MSKGEGYREKLKRNWLEIVAFAAMAFFFYIQMVNGGVATHDELMNLLQVRLGTYFQNLNWVRWGMTLMNAVPSYIHALCTSEWTYRLFTLVGLLAACLSFGALMKKLTDSWVAWVILLLFFMFAQIELDHDGLIAFSFSYQFNTCYVFLALSLYYDYLRNRRKGLLIVSALLYLLACMAYEAFVLYGVLFFLLDLAYWIDRGQVHVVNLFRDLALHAFLAALYVVSYMIVRAQPGMVNNDSTIGANIAIREILGTELKLTFGLFPLNYRSMTLKEFLSASVEPTYTNLLRWFLIALMLLVIARTVTSAQRISLKKYLRLSLFCMVGMLLPGIMTSLTDQYINWIYYMGIKSYGVSYYAYFFIMGWIALTLVFFYQHIPLKRLGLLLVLVVIGLGTEFTFINNEVYTDSLDNNQDRYDLFLNLVDSQYFAGIEDDAQLYAPDYIGIHYNIVTLAQYANARTGKHITAANRSEALDYGRPVYHLRADTRKDVLYFGRIDEKGLTDEIYIYALESLEGCGLLADRDDTTVPAAVLNVGKSIVNCFGTEIITTDLNVKDRSMVVRCKDLVAGSVAVYEADSYDNGLISTFGIYGQENFGRWAMKQFGLRIDNLSKLETMRVALRLYAPMQPEGLVLSVSCGDYTQELTMNADEDVSVEIPLGPGMNEIVFTSSAGDLDAPGDSRSLNLQIRRLILSLGDGEMQFTTND